LRRPQFRTPTDAESSARLYHAVYTRDVQQEPATSTKMDAGDSFRPSGWQQSSHLRPRKLSPSVRAANPPSEMGREPLFPQILRSRGRRSTTRAHRVR
jgi:hypothetical protein